MARKPLTYADAQRIGKGQMTLTMWRVWWQYAKGVLLGEGDRELRLRIHAAWEIGGGDKSLVTVNLTEAEAKRVIEVCRATDRLRTADALEAALRLVKANKADDDGKAARREAFAQLAADGELSPEEIAAGKRSGLL